ncbi:MAG: hypothetical protein ACREP2_13340, partial [Rhodanobacteraceae bacterium]
PMDLAVVQKIGGDLFLYSPIFCKQKIGECTRHTPVLASAAPTLAHVGSGPRTPVCPAKWGQRGVRAARSRNPGHSHTKVGTAPAGIAMLGQESWRMGGAGWDGASGNRHAGTGIITITLDARGMAALAAIDFDTLSVSHRQRGPPWPVLQWVRSLNKEGCHVFVGLDVGYGQTKLSYAPPVGLRKDLVWPSGAAPIEYCDTQIIASANGARHPLASGMEIRIAGRRFGALMPPDAISGGMPYLHEDYPATPEYLALAVAALSHVPGNWIDVLVTGLPVAHHREPAKREALRARLCRQHAVNGRTLTVARVEVVAQGLGAFVSNSHPHKKRKLTD